jgi:enoyl-CoA hydratase
MPSMSRRRKKGTDMQTGDVVVQRLDGLVDIELNRPEVGNVLTAAMASAIVEALADLDDDIRLVRLRARGPQFCVGRESPMPAAGTVVAAEVLRRTVARPVLALYDALKQARVPVFGVVRGPAIGAGCALAAVCDLTLASDDAIFQVPELDRDLPPALVMAALADRVPVKALAHLVLTRARLSAGEALAAGLISQVVAVDHLEVEMKRLSALILGASATSTRAVKQYLRWAPQAPAGAASALAEHLLATAISERYAIERVGP